MNTSGSSDEKPMVKKGKLNPNTSSSSPQSNKKSKMSATSTTKKKSTGLIVKVPKFEPDTELVKKEIKIEEIQLVPLKCHKGTRTLKCHKGTRTFFECKACTMKYDTMYKYKKHLQMAEHQALCRSLKPGGYKELGGCCPVCKLKFNSMKSLRRHLRKLLLFPGKIKCQYCEHTFRSEYSMKRHIGMVHYKRSVVDKQQLNLMQTTSPSTSGRILPAKCSSDTIEKKDIESASLMVSSSPGSQNLEIDYDDMLRKGNNGMFYYCKFCCFRRKRRHRVVWHVMEHHQYCVPCKKPLELPLDYAEHVKTVHNNSFPGIYIKSERKNNTFKFGENSNTSMSEPIFKKDIVDSDDDVLYSLNVDGSDLKSSIKSPLSKSTPTQQETSNKTLYTNTPSVNLKHFKKCRHKKKYLPPVFNCKFCDKSYALKQSLFRHIRIVHLVCTVCSAEFRTASTFITHMQRKHNMHDDRILSVSHKLPVKLKNLKSSSPGNQKTKSLAKNESSSGSPRTKNLLEPSDNRDKMEETPENNSIREDLDSSLVVTKAQGSSSRSKLSMINTDKTCSVEIIPVIPKEEESEGSTGVNLNTSYTGTLGLTNKYKALVKKPTLNITRLFADHPITSNDLKKNITSSNKASSVDTDAEVYVVELPSEKEENESVLEKQVRFDSKDYSLKVVKDDDITSGKKSSRSRSRSIPRSRSSERGSFTSERVDVEETNRENTCEDGQRMTVVVDVNHSKSKPRSEDTVENSSSFGDLRWTCSDDPFSKTNNSSPQDSIQSKKIKEKGRKKKNDVVKDIESHQLEKHTGSDGVGQIYNKTGDESDNNRNELGHFENVEGNIAKTRSSRSASKNVHKSSKSEREKQKSGENATVKDSSEQISGELLNTSNTFETNVDLRKTKESDVQVVNDSETRVQINSSECSVAADSGEKKTGETPDKNNAVEMNVQSSKVKDSDQSRDNSVESVRIKDIRDMRMSAEMASTLQKYRDRSLMERIPIVKLTRMDRSSSRESISRERERKDHQPVYDSESSYSSRQSRPITRHNRKDSLRSMDSHDRSSSLDSFRGSRENLAVKQVSDMEYSFCLSRKTRSRKRDSLEKNLISKNKSAVKKGKQKSDDRGMKNQFKEPVSSVDNVVTGVVLNGDEIDGNINVNSGLENSILSDVDSDFFESSISNEILSDMSFLDESILNEEFNILDVDLAKDLSFDDLDTVEEKNGCYVTLKKNCLQTKDVALGLIACLQLAKPSTRSNGHADVVDDLSPCKESLISVSNLEEGDIQNVPQVEHSKILDSFSDFEGDTGVSGKCDEGEENDLNEKIKDLNASVLRVRKMKKRAKKYTPKSKEQKCENKIYPSDSERTDKILGMGKVESVAENVGLATMNTESAGLASVNTGVAEGDGIKFVEKGSLGVIDSNGNVVTCVSGNYGKSDDIVVQELANDENNIPTVTGSKITEPEQDQDVVMNSKESVQLSDEGSEAVVVEPAYTLHTLVDNSVVQVGTTCYLKDNTALEQYNNVIINENEVKNVGDELRDESTYFNDQIDKGKGLVKESIDQSEKDSDVCHDHQNINDQTVNEMKRKEVDDGSKDDQILEAKGDNLLMEGKNVCNTAEEVEKTDLASDSGRKGSVFACNWCDKTYRFKTGLRKHKEHRHANQISPEFKQVNKGSKGKHSGKEESQKAKHIEKKDNHVKDIEKTATEKSNIYHKCKYCDLEYRNVKNLAHHLNACHNEVYSHDGVNNVDIQSEQTGTSQTMRSPDTLTHLQEKEEIMDESAKERLIRVNDVVKNLQGQFESKPDGSKEQNDKTHVGNQYEDVKSKIEVKRNWSDLKQVDIDNLVNDIESADFQTSVTAESCHQANSIFDNIAFDNVNVVAANVSDGNVPKEISDKIIGAGNNTLTPAGDCRSESSLQGLNVADVTMAGDGVVHVEKKEMSKVNKTSEMDFASVQNRAHERTNSKSPVKTCSVSLPKLDENIINTVLKKSDENTLNVKEVQSQPFVKSTINVEVKQIQPKDMVKRPRGRPRKKPKILKEVPVTQKSEIINESLNSLPDKNEIVVSGNDRLSKDSCVPQTPMDKIDNVKSPQRVNKINLSISESKVTLTPKRSTSADNSENLECDGVDNVESLEKNVQVNKIQDLISPSKDIEDLLPSNISANVESTKGQKCHSAFEDAFVSYLKASTSSISPKKLETFDELTSNVTSSVESDPEIEFKDQRKVDESKGTKVVLTRSVSDDSLADFSNGVELISEESSDAYADDTTSVTSEKSEHLIKIKDSENSNTESRFLKRDSLLQIEKELSSKTINKSEQSSVLDDAESIQSDALVDMMQEEMSLGEGQQENVTSDIMEKLKSMTGIHVNIVRLPENKKVFKLGDTKLKRKRRTDSVIWKVLGAKTQAQGTSLNTEETVDKVDDGVGLNSNIENSETSDVEIGQQCILDRENTVLKSSSASMEQKNNSILDQEDTVLKSVVVEKKDRKIEKKEKHSRKEEKFKVPEKKELGPVSEFEMALEASCNKEVKKKKKKKRKERTESTNDTESQNEKMKITTDNKQATDQVPKLNQVTSVSDGAVKPMTEVSSKIVRKILREKEMEKEKNAEIDFGSCIIKSFEETIGQTKSLKSSGEIAGTSKQKERTNFGLKKDSVFKEPYCSSPGREENDVLKKIYGSTGQMKISKSFRKTVDSSGVEDKLDKEFRRRSPLDYGETGNQRLTFFRGGMSDNQSPMYYSDSGTEDELKKSDSDGPEKVPDLLNMMESMLHVMKSNSGKRGLLSGSGMLSSPKNVQFKDVDQSTDTSSRSSREGLFGNVSTETSEPTGGLFKNFSGIGNKNRSPLKTPFSSSSWSKRKATDEIEIPSRKRKLPRLSIDSQATESTSTTEKISENQKERVSEKERLSESEKLANVGFKIKDKAKKDDLIIKVDKTRKIVTVLNSSSDDNKIDGDFVMWTDNDNKIPDKQSEIKDGRLIMEEQSNRDNVDDEEEPGFKEDERDNQEGELDNGEIYSEGVDTDAFWQADVQDSVKVDNLENLGMDGEEELDFEEDVEDDQYNEDEQDVDMADDDDDDTINFGDTQDDKVDEFENDIGDKTHIPKEKEMAVTLDVNINSNDDNRDKNSSVICKGGKNVIHERFEDKTELDRNLKSTIISKENNERSVTFNLQNEMDDERHETDEDSVRKNKNDQDSDSESEDDKEINKDSESEQDSDNDGGRDWEFERNDTIRDTEGNAEQFRDEDAISFEADSDLDESDYKGDDADESSDSYKSQVEDESDAEKNSSSAEEDDEQCLADNVSVCSKYSAVSRRSVRSTRSRRDGTVDQDYIQLFVDDDEDASFLHDEGSVIMSSNNRPDKRERARESDDEDGHNSDMDMVDDASLINAKIQVNQQVNQPRQMPDPSLKSIPRVLFPKNVCYFNLTSRCLKSNCTFRHTQLTKEDLYNFWLDSLENSFRKNYTKGPSAFDCYKNLKTLKGSPIEPERLSRLFDVAVRSKNVDIVFRLCNDMAMNHLLSTRRCNEVIYLCQHNPKIYSDPLFRLFDIIQRNNIQPSHECLVILLTSFYDKSDWIKLWQVLHYCNEFDDFFPPLKFLKRALDVTISFPQEYMEHLVKWAHNFETKKLEELDPERIQQTVLQVSGTAGNTMGTSDINKGSVTDKIQLPPSGYSQPSDINAADSEVPEDMANNEEDYKHYRHRIHGCHITKNWDYLGSIFTELCCNNDLNNSCYVDAYVEALWDNKSPGDIPKHLEEFITKADQAFEAEKQENVLAQFDLRSLTLICNKMLYHCHEKKYWDLGYDILIVVCRKDVPCQKYFIPGKKNIIQTTMEICINQGHPGDAFKIVQGTDFEILNSQIIYNSRELRQLFDKLILQLIEADELKEACTFLAALLTRADTDSKFTIMNSQIEFGLKFDKIITQALNNVYDPELALIAYQCHGSSQIKTTLPLATLRALLAACGNANLQEEAKGIYERLRRSQVYPVQNYQEIPRQIQLHNLMTATEIHFIISDYLNTLYNYFCQQQMDGNALTGEDLCLTIAVGCPQQQFNLPCLEKWSYKSMSGLTNDILNILKNKLLVPLTGNINHARRCINIKPQTLENYMQTKDMEGRRQGLRFISRKQPMTNQRGGAQIKRGTHWGRQGRPYHRK